MKKTHTFQQIFHEHLLSRTQRQARYSLTNNKETRRERIISWSRLKTKTGRPEASTVNSILSGAKAGNATALENPVPPPLFFFKAGNLNLDVKSPNFYILTVQQ